MVFCSTRKVRFARHASPPGHRRVQIAIVLVVLSAIWYTPWLIRHADYAHPLLSVPFVTAFIYLIFQVHISVINNWKWARLPVLEVPRGQDYPVAVIVPTYGESADMVRRTLVSVLKQDWPNSSLVIVVSDDGASDDMAAMVFALSQDYPAATIRYHRPPPHGSPERQGDAKAGNLNSALDLLDKEYPAIQYVETRDADDEVVHPRFIRRALAPLLDDQRVAFAQTIKDARVSYGDPFNNRELLFYRGVMYGRHAANAVFPCGSGVIWRRQALKDIGGFPSWNIVEDLQSGVEALKRGWRGVYVSIVGARAQHAPEDLGNLCKQRGTWALDTMRLLIWRRLDGMRLRQKLHFFDMALFYCQGFPMLILYILSMVYIASGTQPLRAPTNVYLIHFAPYILSVELFIWAMAAEAGGTSLLVIRRMWHGLMFVYMKAVIMALVYGPNRKPSYRVTRKNHIHRWYLRPTLPHILTVSAIVVVTIYGTMTHGITVIMRPDVVYWLLMVAIPLGSFIPLGWYGMSVRQSVLSRFRRTSAPRGLAPGASLDSTALTVARAMKVDQQA